MCVCVCALGGYHIKEEGLHGSRGGRPAEGGLRQKGCLMRIIMTALAPLECRHPRLGQSLWRLGGCVCSVLLTRVDGF